MYWQDVTRSSPCPGAKDCGTKRAHNFLFPKSSFRIRSTTVLGMFKDSAIMLYAIQRSFLDKSSTAAIWCVFVRASLHMRREEKPTRCHWMLYCTYDMLNMFRALLFPSSGAWDCMCVLLPHMVCSAWLLVVGGQVQGSRLWVQEERCCTTAVAVVQHPSSWTHSLLSCTWPPATSNQALHTIGGNNTHSLEHLMMGIEVPETCWAYHKCNKAFSNI